MKYVVLALNVSYGPFDSENEAIYWAYDSIHSAARFQIIPLYPPNTTEKEEG